MTFLESLSGINNWSATVAAWQDPQNGNYLVQPGMLVSGACVANGTTVSAVNRVPGTAAYGTITLSSATSSACAAGAAITFTIAPAQLQILTTDWLGIQGAMAAAWLNTQSGGSIYIPTGNYLVNHSLINAGGVTDTTFETPNLDIHGDGVAESRITFTYDLGPDTCGMSEATPWGHGHLAFHVSRLPPHRTLRLLRASKERLRTRWTGFALAPTHAPMACT